MNYPAEVRFWRRVEVDDATGCWVWTGTMDQNGYARMNDQGKQWTVHRWSYVRSCGNVPIGLQLDHLCRNRACVNPDHLEPVTARVNNLRGVGHAALNAVKTHCLNGHPLTPGNLVSRKDRNARECRACHNERRRQYYRNKRREVTPNARQRR